MRRAIAGLVVALVACAVVFVVWLVVAWLRPSEAEKLAVQTLERSGHHNVSAQGSYEANGCAVVNVEYDGGRTSVALTKSGGQWRVRVLTDGERGIAFDSDDASGGGCERIVSSGGHIR